MDPATPQTPTPAPSTAPRRPWYRRRWFVIGAPLALISLFAARGFARGFHGGCHGGELTSAEAIEHAKDVIAFAGRKLDATPEQQKKLEALAEERVPLLMKHRDEAHALRGKLHDAVARDDRAALEALRVQGVALADRASTEVLATYARLADILTPAQRQQLVERLGRRRHGWHGGGHDDQGPQAGRSGG